MATFIPFNRDQAFLLPPDLKAWLPEGDLAHFVVAAVERVSLGAFDLAARAGGNPSVHQSGEGRPQHGRITKQGRAHARTMLVEGAWQAVRSPGPLRAFYQRIGARRGNHVAAVAVARKLAVIVWHMLTRGEDYAGVRPALHARKLRDLELRSGQPNQKGRRGSGYAYNLTRVRQEEKHQAKQAEVAYRRITEGWTKRGRRPPTDAAKERRP